eukprot:gnl/TRDRNA2_/TRDRNA2_140070_c0_seq2.p1 gnl/TRDRNA2_/TRDRNA2_140070_c0~~gnl/TRDRNA2_/TRDRNA2_140070_c0_seq2.p1  ORF type:complete len:333 (-),score=57.54 gnl/TRDRNA2_/TRDRNA2_140070_c0_seq2:103-1101(-)
MMPSEAREHEKKMHGCFNEDPETGTVYTGIAGYGLVSISRDLRTWKKLGEDPRLKKNMHGLVVFKHKGETLIAAAQEGAQQVLILGLDGDIRQIVKKPTGGEFDFAEANDYYEKFKDVNHQKLSFTTKKGKVIEYSVGIFACTDVTFLNGRLYVVTGYCPGDFVLTLTETEGQWHWGPRAWGGRGNQPGQFQTAHGIFAYDRHVYVANREACQVVKFTAEGDLVEILPGIPPGSRICNVGHADHDDYFVFNPLLPLTEKQKSAPIFAYADGGVISTVVPGDLGIPVLRYIHHVWPHYAMTATGKKHLYLLVHGWNDGKFAVLKHEPDMESSL